MPGLEIAIFGEVRRFQESTGLWLAKLTSAAPGTPEPVYGTGSWLSANYAEEQNFNQGRCTRGTARKGGTTDQLSTNPKCFAFL